jgi:hypothetical protein
VAGVRLDQLKEELSLAGYPAIGGMKSGSGRVGVRNNHWFNPLYCNWFALAFIAQTGQPVKALRRLVLGLQSNTDRAMMRADVILY